MAYCTNIYKCINISLDRYDDLKKLEECMAENIKDGKYIEEVEKNEKEAIIEFFDKEFAPAYEENNVEPEPEEE